MIYEVRGSYYSTREDAEDEEERLERCGHHDLSIKEFVPRYWAVERNNNGEGDEFTLYLGDKNSLGIAIRKANDSYHHLTTDEKKKKEVAVYLVDDDFLSEDKNGGIIGGCWETLWLNGKDFTTPYVDEHARVRINGNSYTVAITRAVRDLDLQDGDEIIITVQKKLRKLPQ